MKKIFYIIYQVFLHLLAVSIITTGIFGIIYTLEMNAPTALHEITQILLSLVFVCVIGFGFVSLCILSKK